MNSFESIYQAHDPALPDIRWNLHNTCCIIIKKITESAEIKFNL